MPHEESDAQAAPRDELVSEGPRRHSVDSLGKDSRRGRGRAEAVHGPTTAKRLVGQLVSEAARPDDGSSLAGYVA